MKLLFTFIILFSTTCFSQNLVVHYKKSSINQKSNTPSSNHTLTFKDGISYFTQEPIEKEIPNIDMLPEDVKKTILADIKKNTNEKYYYKNFVENELLTIISGQQVVDSIFNWNWQITEEVKSIQGLECNKAVSNFLGFPFVAWYTTEIPINTGPEFYHGLPGLILHAYNSGFEYQATLIEFPESLPDIEKPAFKSDKTLTFIEAQNNLQTPSKSKVNFHFSPDGNTTIQSSTLRRINKN